MVTRLYTPLIPNAARGNTLRVNGDEASSNRPPSEDQKPVQESLTANPLAKSLNNPTAPNAPAIRAQASYFGNPSTSLGRTELASSRLQKTETPLALQTLQAANTAARINAGAVLADFTQTTRLLGAPPEVGQTVQAYLKVVELEAAKPSPSKSLIQSALRAAAQGLDEHVSEALQLPANQPSTVVGEWIDALLEQPIDWELPPDYKPLPLASQSNPPGETTDEQTPSAANAGQLKTLLGAYKQAKATGNWPKAQTLIEKAQNLAQNAPLPLQIKLGQLEGQTYQAQGQLWQAEQAYNKALALSQQLPGMQQTTISGPLLLQLGQVALAQGNPQQAENQFLSALNGLPSASDLPATLPNWTPQGWLGLAQAQSQLGQAKSAQQSYKQALSSAKMVGAPALYQKGLTQWAMLALQQGQAAQARQLLSLSAQLEKTT